MSENNYGALMMKSAVGASDDINAIFQPGIYIIPPSNTSSPDATGGVLTVHSGTPIRRTFTSDALICLTSTRNGSTWSLWKGPLSRINPFADIKADGAAAVSTALSNLGLGDVVHLANFTSGVNWRRTPDGYIEQWGQSAVANSSTGVAVATFPIPFPTECLSVQISEVTGTSIGNSGVKSWGVRLDTLTNTGVSGVLDVTGSPATGEFFLYKAIGR